MSNSADLPNRHQTHITNAQAVHHFEAAILEAGVLFARKEAGDDDYGTDFQLEVVDSDAVTNFRAHVQLKGTRTPSNPDGSISISVKRTTLNYLLSQPDSIFVCCHLTENRILAVYAYEVFQQYERHGDDWRSQQEVTVRFRTPFDQSFQRELAGRILARGKEGRSERDMWAMTPPENYSTVLWEVVPTIEVPHNKAEAKAILSELFNSGQDDVISKAFPKFASVLDENRGEMDQAYMAEINLGIRSKRSHSHSRILKAVEVLQAAIERRESHPGSVHYCIGNAWSALAEHSKALECFSRALDLLAQVPEATTKAYCLKNKGFSHERLGDFQAARMAYEEALRVNPDLPEAHLAMGHWHRLHNRDYLAAITHFDLAIPDNAAVSLAMAPQAWKAECLFLADKSDDAFKEIRGLQRMASQVPWIQGWCAQLVAMHGRKSLESAKAAKDFWKWFLRRSPDDLKSKRELFMCYSYLDAEGIDSGLSYAEFKALAQELIGKGDSETALLWDRVGHWAQRRTDWEEAEACYRKASDLDHKAFGYCLGTALNHLGRFEEAFPLLRFQAEEHLKDALSWFQVAIALEGTGDIDGCIAAYWKALELDQDYDLAWFNLGGIFWNAGMLPECADVWLVAINKFPDHPLAAQARMCLIKATE